MNAQEFDKKKNRERRTYAWLVIRKEAFVLIYLALGYDENLKRRPSSHTHPIKINNK